MALDGKKTFTGFGFGAIQAGLFLYEAYRSGESGRLVVAEVMPETVRTVKEAGGRFMLNIARSDRIDSCETGPVEIYDPATHDGRETLINSVAESSEIATAVPGVRYYVTQGSGSIHRILAEGLCRKAERGGPRAVVYCAENHNRAAEIFEEAVFEVIPEDEREKVRSLVRFIDTVIGKMSGIITDKQEVEEYGIATITPGDSRAFLVEEFNRILISKISYDTDDFQFDRGIKVFEEKDDLMPFCEAKLYGHNATHAVAGYIGSLCGLRHVAELRQRQDIIDFLRSAFITESGSALIKKHKGEDDLFTESGYRTYADDLLDRMMNPYLHDSIERICRGTERKLGWDDRLTGTIRLALSQGINPALYAFGTASAIACLDRRVLDEKQRAVEILHSIWQGAVRDESEERMVLEHITEAIPHLAGWLSAGCPLLNITSSG